MADLVVTISESVNINGAVRGSANSLTTSNIVDTFERVLTCAHTNTTTIATFATTPHTSAGALDVENCKYLRVTNLSTSEDMKVAFVTSASNYQVTVRAGGSHMLFQAEEGIFGDDDATPLFPTLQDIVTVQVRPSGGTDVQVEIFAAMV